MRKFIVLLLAPFSLLVSCKEESIDSDPYGAVNREAILVNLADNLVIPSYQGFLAKATVMNDKVAAFSQDPNGTTLQAARTAWITAYESWQKVALWNIGPAMEEALLFNANIYPTDVLGIESSLSSGNLFDLNSINTPKDVQGFPAIGYLLYGDNKTGPEIISSFADANRKAYLTALSDRIVSLTTEVLNAWQNGYRDEFVHATGLDRGSSMGELFNNTLLPYFEKHNRDAKFGYPGGLRGESPLPENVEGLYSRIHSKKLALSAFSAYKNAWLGVSSSKVKGESLLDYVAFMDARLKTSNATRLSQQLNQIESSITSLADNFYEIASTNPGELDAVWSECQKMIPIIKTDIQSALSVTISYTDTDGD